MRPEIKAIIMYNYPLEPHGTLLYYNAKRHSKYQTINLIFCVPLILAL